MRNGTGPVPRSEELLAAYRKRFISDYVKGCSPSPGVPVEWFEERGREAMERFEKAVADA